MARKQQVPSGSRNRSVSISYFIKTMSHYRFLILTFIYYFITTKLYVFCYRLAIEHVFHTVHNVILTFEQLVQYQTCFEQIHFCIFVFFYFLHFF